MDGTEFVKRVNRYAKKMRIPCLTLIPRHGKGSHGRLHLGHPSYNRPAQKIGKGLLAAMLKDLNVNKEDF